MKQVGKALLVIALTITIVASSCGIDISAATTTDDALVATGNVTVKVNGKSETTRVDML